MDTPGSAIRFSLSLLLLLTLPDYGSAQVAGTAHQSPYREGLWFTAGLGGAGGEGGLGGTSANLALGWTVNPRVLLGVGSTAVREEFEGGHLTIGTLDFRAQYYPEATAGLFATGGLGLGFWGLGDGGTGPDIGAGIVFGIGYDIHVATSFNFTTYVNWFHFHTSDPRGSAIAFGLGLAFH